MMKSYLKSTLTSHSFRSVSNAYRIRNEDVELSHIEIRNQEHPPQKNMIVMHGLLGNKLNWRGLCNRPEISAKRNCYLVELRNHATSNHHDTMNYNVISDDVIRFADKQGLDRFTVLGHSLGGRTAMTVACRFPDRVDACISVDAAPINEQSNKAFGEFTYSVISFMSKLSDEGVSRDEAVKRAGEFFRGKLQFVSLLERNLDPNHKEEIKWLVNVEALMREFINIPYFDEELRYQGPCLQIVGGKSRIYQFEQYKKVFTNISRQIKFFFSSLILLIQQYNQNPEFFRFYGEFVNNLLLELHFKTLSQRQQLLTILQNRMPFLLKLCTNQEQANRFQFFLNDNLMSEDDVKIVADAGHWVHFDKPIETINLISEFLAKVDSK